MTSRHPTQSQPQDLSHATKKLYIAGMGMVSPIGENVAITAAMVDSEVSAYRASHFSTAANQKITMAQVPDDMIGQCEATIEEGDCFNIRHDRVTRLAILALQQTCAQLRYDQAIPLILAMPDGAPQNTELSAFTVNIANNMQPWINPAMSRSLYSGRASGIEAIDFAFQYLYGNQYPYILVGGSDSYADDTRLRPLDKHQRLLSPGASDAFAPGEAASFLLLTPHVSQAQQHNGYVIALNTPGIADEAGHLYSKSETPYLGEGLDRAFKSALLHQAPNSIDRIYSSMNGENYWAKEYGVAYIRSQAKFKDPTTIQHPADCYGDLGSATATALISLAATHLLNSHHANSHLVYSSSDTAKRGAIVVEKLRIDK